MKTTVRCCLAALMLCLGAAAGAQTRPCTAPAGQSGIPDVSLTRVADGFTHPVHIAGAGDGRGRLFVVEQAGVVRIIADGKIQPRPFLDIRDRVASGGEKGLLSTAFHPQFRRNGRVFVDYTTDDNGLHTIVSEFRLGRDGMADAGSERVLLRVRQPYGNHNGGQLAFGPDGFLYIGLGDGGDGNDPHNHGQNPATLLGAILRIDVDRRPAGRGYAIPADNPFAAHAAYRPEIWAYGLRNPWRFSFDAGSGRLYAADVGEDRREEIDIIERGGNYGWRIMEGDICTPKITDPCEPRGLTPPIHAYAHDVGRSITGGFVYRGRAMPALCGVYLFADYVSGRLWGLRDDGAKVTAIRELLHTSHHISSFGQGDDLELYIADHQAGAVYRIVPANR